MAQKISIQIALEGAAEIDRQLASLGETGKKAFEEMRAAAEQVGGFSQLDTTEVTRKLQDMGITGVDAINQIQEAVASAGNLEGMVQGVKQLENGFTALGKVIRPLGGEFRKVQQAAAALYGVIGTVGVGSVAAFAAISAAATVAVKATVGFADSINKVNDEAIRLGVSAGAMDKFRAGLEQAGVSAENVGKILQSKLASEQGVGGLQRFIRQLEMMPDSLQRSKAAVEQFGAAGAELIRILQAGGRLTGFATQGLINEGDAEKATKLGQAINRLESAWNRFNSVQAAPVITAGVNTATAAVEVLGQRLGTLAGTASVAAQGLFTPFQLGTQLAVAGVGQVITKAQEVGPAVQKVGTVFTQWGTVAVQAGMKAGEATQLATVGFTSYGTVVAGATTKTEGFAASIASITWDYIKSDGVQAWAIVTSAVGPAVTAVGQFASSILSIAWDMISGLGVAAWNALTGAIQGAIAALLRYVGITPTPPTGAPSGVGHNAAGGLLGGRGTGTSDSNLAWVSRGEYITPARAVRQPGVLAFLEALRRSGGDLRRALDGMGRFALGGMVPRAIPAFAGGGLAGGGSHVTIQFPGLPAISGLRASSDVVDQLHRAAALAQVRSGGRKPSRYS